MPVNNKIKIRRGNNIDLPAGGTESGELRYSIDTKELYIDDGSLNIKIGGDPYAFPISTATQTALDGKQLIGTYATGTGTANGTNTGDETLTSIKTKLGAATAVSDGYLKYQDFADFSDRVSNATHTGDVTGSTALTLATVNSNVGTFNNVTINAKGLATAGSNVSYEPSFSKNTAFNKNFGTTTGTVLEGRTFGTAANSAVGDFIQNQNSSAQTANMWISGDVKSASITFPTTGYALIGENYFYRYDGTTMGLNGNFRTSGAATFSSTVNSTGFLLNGNNLTSSLTTNFIPKWNGSSFVNGLIYNSTTGIGINTSTPLAKFDIRSGIARTSSASTDISYQLSSDADDFRTGMKTSITGGASASARSFDIHSGTLKVSTGAFSNSGESLRFNPDGGNIQLGGTTSIILIPSTTPSTSPTNGALVVVGGVGANHVRANNFYGNGSNLTGVQLPITLTTNGTSGAATFENGVMNVPNYTSTGIGGSYTASISSGSNTANPVVYSSLYTKNGTVYSSIIKGYIECTGSQGNTCTFNVSTYNGSTANLSIIGVGAQGTNIILGSGSTGSNVVMSFTNPVGSGGIGFTLIIHYTN